MQRDLSDSTVLRGLSEALARTGLAWSSLLNGLGRIEFDAAKASVELDGHWEVLAEAVQTLLRDYEEIEDPYTLLKEMTRTGSALSAADYKNFVQQSCSSVLRPDDLEYLQNYLTPHKYIGLAPQIVENVLKQLV